jgi:hypothetical protein
LRLGLIVVAIALLGSARGQTFSAHYGSQGALSGNRIPPIPHFGLHLGAELEWNEWSLGVRASGSSLLVIFLWQAALDAYVGYRLESGLSMYAGAGRGYWLFILPGADGNSASAWDWHGLVGVRFSSGLFLEVIPSALAFERCTAPDGSSQSCSSTFWLSLNVGWNLKF